MLGEKDRVGLENKNEFGLNAIARSLKEASKYDFFTEPDPCAAKRYGMVIGYTPNSAILVDDENRVYYLPVLDPELLPLGTSESVDGLAPMCTLDELNAAIEEREARNRAENT